MSLIKKILIISSFTLLISCGSKTVYVTEVLPTTSTLVTLPPVTTEPYNDYSTTRQNFLDSVRTLNPLATSYISDEELVGFAITVCDGLQSGMSAMDIAAVVAASSEGDPQISEFLSSVTAAAITFYCPDQLYKFEDF